MKKLLFIVFLILAYQPSLFSQDYYIDEWKNKNIAVSPDSKLLAYIHYEAGWGGHINIFDIEKKYFVKKEIKSDGVESYSSLHFSPDGKYLAWNKYGVLSFYELSTGKIESFKMKIFESDGFKFNFSPVNNLIVACTNNGNNNAKIYLVDIKSLSVLKNFETRWLKWYESISFDGNFVAVTGEGKINLFSFFPTQSVNTISLKESYANSFSVSSNFKYAVIFNSSINIANLSDLSITNKDRPNFVDNVFSSCFSPLDQYIAYSYYGGYKSKSDGIVISDLYGNTVTTLGFEQPEILTFTPNGKYLICVGYFGIKLWDTKKLFNYISYYSNYYDMYFKDYQNDLKAVFEKSKTKDEFETQPEYEARIASAFDLKKSIDEKYNSLFTSLINLDIEKQNSEYDKKNSELQDKINKSIEPVETKITSVGTYIIESELLPVTINGVTENVKIKRDEAKSLKENFASAIVKGKKRFKYDLKTYEFFELLIIHPISKSEYKFGNW